MFKLKHLSIVKAMNEYTNFTLKVKRHQPTSFTLLRSINGTAANIPTRSLSREVYQPKCIA